MKLASDAQWRLRGRLLYLLWSRLLLAGSALGAFAMVMNVLPEITAWPLYRNTREMIVAAAVSILLGLAGGAVLGTVAALLSAPALFFSKAPESYVARVHAVAGIAAGFVCGTILIRSLIIWLGSVFHFAVLNFYSALASVIISGVISAWVAYRPSARKQVTAELESAFTGKTTRRLVLGMTAGTLATTAIGAPPLAYRPSRLRVRASGPNVLLVTFDALTAEHMSLYGHARQTTPHIDALARGGTKFTNFYSTSTYTTPSIASIVTGRYPSSTHIIHLKDQFRGDTAAKTLVRTLRDHGYTTAASFNNPWAHPGRMGLGAEFDELPPPPGLSAYLPEFATRQSFMDVLLYEATDAAFLPERLEMFAPALFQNIHETFGPEANFRQAEEVLRRLDGPYFLWAHVLAPHFPYQPSPPYLHRYLKDDRMRSNFDYWAIAETSGGGPYLPQRQPLVDLASMRYDEWVAQTDGVFGAFLERVADKLNDTIIIVSSDHGESFDGGFWSHGGDRQLRSIVHVPLVIRRPGQKASLRVDTAADHTALAPTILDLAGLQIPSWMEGRSLKPFLDGRKNPEERGYAFTEFFDQNSAFKPLRKGTVGVIDGDYQYVHDVAAHKGRLYRLAEAHIQADDRSLAEPEKAEQLKREILMRFPEFARGSP